MVDQGSLYQIFRKYTFLYFAEKLFPKNFTLVGQYGILYHNCLYVSNPYFTSYRPQSVTVVMLLTILLCQKEHSYTQGLVLHAVSHTYWGSWNVSPLVKGGQAAIIILISEMRRICSKRLSNPW